MSCRQSTNPSNKTTPFQKGVVTTKDDELYIQPVETLPRGDIIHSVHRKRKTESPATELSGDEVLDEGMEEPDVLSHYGGMYGMFDVCELS